MIEYCHTGNFSFPVLIFKIFKSQNHSANLDQNCEIHSKEVLVNDVNGIINSEKFSRSYDDLYLGITFFGTHGNLHNGTDDICSTCTNGCLISICGAEFWVPVLLLKWRFHVLGVGSVFLGAAAWISHHRCQIRDPASSIKLKPLKLRHDCNQTNLSFKHIINFTDLVCCSRINIFTKFTHEIQLRCCHFHAKF